MRSNYGKISNCYKYWAGGHRYHTLTPNLKIFNIFSNQNPKFSPQLLLERQIPLKEVL